MALAPAWIEFTARSEAAGDLVLATVIAWLFLLDCAGATWFSSRDQPLHCPVCLHQLLMATTIGSWSSSAAGAGGG